MNPSEIFGPVLTMFVLTFAVWFYLYVRRLPFVFSGEFKPDRGTSLELDMASPAGAVHPSDNLKNLFELPVIFYGLVIALFMTGQVDTTYLTAAWLFAGFRILHSAMHCTLNVIPVRFLLYLISAFALWFMVFRAAYAYFYLMLSSAV